MAAATRRGATDGADQTKRTMFTTLLGTAPPPCEIRHDPKSWARGMVTLYDRAPHEVRRCQRRARILRIAARGPDALAAGLRGELVGARLGERGGAAGAREARDLSASGRARDRLLRGLGRAAARARGADRGCAADRAHAVRRRGTAVRSARTRLHAAFRGAVAGAARRGDRPRADAGRDARARARRRRGAHAHRLDRLDRDREAGAMARRQALADVGADRTPRAAAPLPRDTRARRDLEPAERRRRARPRGTAA